MVLDVYTYSTINITEHIREIKFDEEKMSGAAEDEYFLIVVTPNSFLSYKISNNIKISMQIDEINLREIKVTYQGFYNNKKDVFIEVKKIFY